MSRPRRGKAHKQMDRVWGAYSGQKSRIYPGDLGTIYSCVVKARSPPAILPSRSFAGRSRAADPLPRAIQYCPAEEPEAYESALGSWCFARLSKSPCLPDLAASVRLVDSRAGSGSRFCFADIRFTCDLDHRWILPARPNNYKLGCGMRRERDWLHQATPTPIIKWASPNVREYVWTCPRIVVGKPVI